MSKKIIFQTVSRILILMTILGLFLTCDDGNGPLSSNMGPKVVVEPPTIFNISPESGSFINGVQKITATTKAYIRVDKVEVYIYEDKDNGQREVKWTSKGITLTGGVKQKDMEFVLDTNLYNNWDFDLKTTVTQKDGKIKMKFRIFDSTDKPTESVDVIYIIKNRPSVIKMAYPPNSEIADPAKEYSKIQRDTEIRGTVIDQRGIRPGYPQIKIWPDKFESGEKASGATYNDGDEPPDDDPRWGWASLFITPSAGSGDDMQKGSPATSTLPAIPAGPGDYLDRSNTRVVNNASFSLHLANYIIDPQPNPVTEGSAPAGEDLNLRYIRYEIDTATGKHIPFATGRTFNFKIRTCDTSLNLQYIPTNTGRFLRGFFPPKDFGLPTEDNFRIRGFYAIDDDLKPLTEQPVKILIFNSDARPSVEIDNNDLGPTPDAVKEITDAKPNIYITEGNSKKIIGTGDLFRLRLLATFGTDNSQPIEAKLTWRHDASGRGGVLALGTSGNIYPGDFAGTYYSGTPNPNGGIGSIFTYLATMANNGSNFTSSSEPYILIFTVKINEDYTEYRYVLYMDGDCPEVSIRSIKGSAEDKASFTAKNVGGGLINGIQSTVNGNIQVVVDRNDDSGIMAYKQNAGMGAEPPRNELNYPMVKWVLEPASETETEPAATGTTLANLINYRTSPSADKLSFFNDIQDTQTTIRASGWVRRPFSLQDNPNASSADRANHFKINTSYLNNTDTPTYYWLYVIAQDQVQNLGFVVQKICVDQSTDKPTIKLPPLLSDKNGAGTAITSETDLDVAITLNLSTPGNFDRTGNNPRNNVLERDQAIEVNLLDDDGIDMVNGVTIWLTALDPTSDLVPPGQKRVKLDAMAAVKSDITRNKRDISLIISQEIMAKALYGAAATETRLKDGMYKIEFELKDDVNEKVKIVRGSDGYPDGRDPALAGDTPSSVNADPHNYYFAVFTAPPEVKITFPDDNAWGSEEPILIRGTARSRLKIQGAWITFTPDVVSATPSNPNPPSKPLKVENLTLNPSTPEAPNPDAEGYYNYTWNYGGLNGSTAGVVFQPKNGGANLFGGDLRTYTVEAYDRLGNAGNVKQNVQMDGTPPEVTLSDYNHNRPPEVLLDSNGEPVLDGGKPVQVTYLYGKVSFTVSASDANGLYETPVENPVKSGIKWWILPATVTEEPTWNTDYTTYTNAPMPGSWQGGGNFNLNQAVNGRYTWVIDTRYLEDKKEYKLCIIALDKAGNQSYFAVTVAGTPTMPQKTTNVYETFIVDQSRDYPVINPNSLDPLENQVKGKGTTISVTVSDLDLFNVVKRNSYVDIRFPTNIKGVPQGWGAWIPITTIPSTFSARYGGIDPSGALVLKFNPGDPAYASGDGAKYLNEDGVRYYQIRVRDESEAPSDADKAAGAKNYGKNPDTFMQADPVKYPAPYQFVEHKRVEIVFPMDKANPTNPTPSGAYSFIVDATPPEIFFDAWDPTPPIGTHPGYTQSRPTFSTVESLIEALSGWVIEDKLSNLSMSYSAYDKSAGKDIFFRKTILSNPEDPPTPGKYEWKLELTTLTDPNGGPPIDEKAQLKKVFDAAPDGMQIIVFEATDMAPQIGRVSYIFAKDKKGPIIEFNISRSIWHIYPSSDLASPDVSIGSSTIPPADSDIPSTWPGDFRNGTTWTTDTDAKWAALRTSYGLKYWASDFALLASDKIIAALATENNRKPSTVIGDAEPTTENPNPNYKPAVIEGKFSDEFSTVRILVPTGAKTYFYYRFKDKTGKLLDIPAINIQSAENIRELSTFTMGPGSILADDSKWLRKEIEAPKPNVDIQNDKTAEWKIELDKAHGFIGTDGENWVDILAQDSAKNKSEIYNLRFVVDRTAPILGEDPNVSADPTNPAKITDADEFIVERIYKDKTLDDPKIPGPLAEMKRVFSGTGNAGNIDPADAAFILTGTVSDFNFSGLIVTIGQEGYSGYSVTAQLSVEPTNATTTNSGVLASSPYDKVTNTILPSDRYPNPAIFDDPTTTPPGIKRLELSNPTFATDGTPTWTWTLRVLQKDIAGLREAAGANAADSARRYIRVTASDKANKRAGPVDWFFYLDTKIPELEYANMEKGLKEKASSFEDGTLELTGTVSDDTRIKDVRYMIGRWDYTDGKWKWYTQTGATYDWSATTPPSPESSWPSVFTDAKTPTRQTSMNWSISQTTLTKAANTFPANLFDQEGYYRLDLYVTDFSLGSGNPHNTMNPADETFMDAHYNNGAGNRSSRAFYVDKKDPDLQWGWVTWDDASKEWVTDTSDKDDTKNRTYFRNDNNGQVNFNFTVGDGNTIQKWNVEVRDNATGKTLLNETAEPGLYWVAGTGSANTNPIPDPDISNTAILNQFKTVKPFMTTDGKADTSPGRDKALDKGRSKLPTYTITITVWDGANRSNSISKSFTLDNTPPTFIKQKYQPPSYKLNIPTTAPPPEPVPDTSPQAYRYYTYDAVSGKLNIRGNAEDNSNKIEKISYYVVNNATGNGIFASGDFLTPAQVTTQNKWLSAVDKNSIISIGPAGDPIKLIQIDEGTFAFKVMVPQTSLFFSSSEAKRYAQITHTGGTTIKGEAGPSAGDYIELEIDSNIDNWKGTPQKVPDLTFPDINNLGNPSNTKKIYGGEEVALITIYLRAEDAAGNVAYDALKYWIWPEGDRPIVTAINSPDSSKIEAERLLNGTIRLSGMAKDNERVKYVWFRVFPSKDGKPTGAPYTLTVPNWNETDWTEAGGNQNAREGNTIGSLRIDDPIDTTLPSTSDPLGYKHGYTGGWYMANGGNSKEVSWWAYINTNGELDPQGNDTKKEFYVEVRAQDITYDELNDRWMPYNPPNGYIGMASAMTTVSSVTAWVVAGAPIFENVVVAPSDSKEADTRNPPLWDTIDNLNIRNRSAYKVTVKHNSGLSSIRWSPTLWDKTLNAGVGGFQANPAADPYNLLDLLALRIPATTGNPYDKANPYTVYWDGQSKTYKTGTQSDVFALMTPTPGSAATPRMAVTVKPGKMFTGNITSGLSTTRSYLILKWDPRLGDYGSGVSSVFVTPTINKESYYESDGAGGTRLKDLKNTVFKTNETGGNIGDAIILEAELDTVTSIEYFKLDIIVDVRADLLLNDMEDYGPPNPNQTRDSVRYPVYLSASEVSKATPLTSKFDSLLPIDNLKPYGAYTLNRRPAGSAATIGGEAGDDGPVNGVARVVLWFSKKGSGTPYTQGKFISWHERGVGNLAQNLDEMPKYLDDKSGPAWWDAIGQPGLPANMGGVIPLGVTKPPIPNKPYTTPTATANGTGGDWAIVIDRNSPSVGMPAWGHTLPMGFADGGTGKYWYVEINSLGIESGPVDLHFVVIDKAGNARYYRERLVIMNNVAVIDRIKLATDIRDNGNLSFPPGNTRTGNNSVNTGALKGTSRILDVIRDAVPNSGDSSDAPVYKNDVKKGISDWVQASALGVNNIVDFNVRNNLFALRVETTNMPGPGKSRSFRLEYVSGATLLANATPTATTLANSIKAGRVYIINDPGTAKWGAIGAEGDGPWQRGYAFIAAINGREDDGTGVIIDKISGLGSVWELNSAYYNPTTGAKTIPTNLALADVPYPLVSNAPDPNALGAEFVYGTNAFTGTGTRIVDYTNDTDLYPPAQGTNPVTDAGNSMFILRVFDGQEDDLFGDFTILRIRVNNNDRTKPFAQLYDINPKTEGQDRQNIAANERARSLAPMSIGEGQYSNRTKGGLWNISPTLGAVEKPGHIEPRRIQGANYGTMYSTPQTGESEARRHSLSSAQMGGAAVKEDATIQKPWANPEGFFTTDTVSGQVVLRGYAEDNQRVHRVVVRIGTQNITILDFQPHTATGAGNGNPGNNDSSSANYSPPLTGLLRIGTDSATNPTTNRVFFTDTIDAYRHRVEWAYIWDTETITGTDVRVISYSRDGAAGTTPKATPTSDEITAAASVGHTNASDATRPNTTPFNKEFPVGINKYNSISFNIRPYITGFLRNKALFSHDTRSRQGRYMFYRGETAVVKGFNLGAGTISLQTAATTNVGAPADYGITETDDNARNRHYRQFTVNTGQATGNGVVTYTATQEAVNTGNARTKITANAGPNTGPFTPATSRPTYIQPWNIEYSPGIDGSQLWDDFTQVHIWQSNETTTNDGGRFPKGNNIEVFDPSMSIDPATGTLWTAHNEGGGGGWNSGTTKIGNNNGQGSLVVAKFVDPIINSDIFVSTRPSGFNNNAGYNYSVWSAYSIIGRSGNTDSWDDYGGVFVSGPQGGWPNLNSSVGNGNNAQNGFLNNNDIAASSQYFVESTGYNAATDTNGNTNWPPGNVDLAAPSRNQFKTPHIVTYFGRGTNQGDTGTDVEHIHVSYYDTKDKSLKYRYNRRNGYGAAVNWGTNAGANNLHYAWTNIDGGVDDDDRNAFNANNNGNWASRAGGGWYRAPFDTYTAAIGENGRVVNHPAGRRSTDAGEYNSIALTRNGYPVIAYYDKANQKLKLAISSATVPIAQTYWTIIQDVIDPAKYSQNYWYGTGEYVSIKIDTKGTTDIVHIAAMNAAGKNLVYIRGTLTAAGAYSTTDVQVVDSVGSVGRWCSLSLDDNGNPWISYQDESYQGSRDGAKLAYYNDRSFYKGGAAYNEKKDTDLYGTPINGWEAMHVPTQFRVENARQGMECIPTRNYGGINSKFWIGAVGFLGQEYFRAAYYVK